MPQLPPLKPQTAQPKLKATKDRQPPARRLKTAGRDRFKGRAR